MNGRKAASLMCVCVCGHKLLLLLRKFIIFVPRVVLWLKWDFTWTFSGNQDATVKLMFKLISIRFGSFLKFLFNFIENVRVNPHFNKQWMALAPTVAMAYGRKLPASAIYTLYFSNLDCNVKLH